MRIREIMSQPVVTCRTDDSLNAAARAMWENDCGALPVVDDRDRVVGMVTDRDLCMAAYTKGRAFGEIQVADAMSRTVLACHSGDSVEDAERLMADEQIRRVPIVDGDDRPIGILSLNDIARCAASRKGGMERELTQTMAAICEPRPRGATMSQQQPQPTAP